MHDLFLLGRLLFGGFFLYNGINHFASNQVFTQYTAAKGVPFPELAVVLGGVLLVVGGLCILPGYMPHVGLACVAGFERRDALDLRVRLSG